MKREIRIAVVAALASLCFCACAGAKVVSFIVPGAQFVTPVGINDKGQVTGTWQDASGYHGFLRQPDGALATFDIPGAHNTHPAAISPAGVVTGWYDEKNRAGGFVRAADGSITTFIVPNGYATKAFGANSRGWSAGGFHTNKSLLLLPFLRSRSGVTTEFSVPGDTGNVIAVAVNRSLTVAGLAGYAAGAYYHAFVRSADGTVTVFEMASDKITVAGINDVGTITGSLSVNDTPNEGFVRTSDGTITTFAPPNGSLTIVVLAINNFGTIAGRFMDSAGATHGFLRAADGMFTPFDLRHASNVAITAISNKGEIAGTYMNKDNVYVGFGGKP
jgi:hypothetical protein